MNSEYKETVRHILQSNRSSFEHLAKQCQSHIERIDNAIKKLNDLQESETTEPVKTSTLWVDELPDKEKFIEFLKDTEHDMWCFSYNTDETETLLLDFLRSIGEKPRRYENERV